MPVLYVIDNTVLSNYMRIGRPELLERAVVPNGVITPAVKEEMELGETLGILPPLNWQWLPVTTLDAVEEGLANEFRRRLDPGEAECLAVAVNRNGIIVTDDRGARQQAIARGVKTSGTIGILRMLVDVGHISLPKADEHLKAMIGEGYHSPVRSLKHLR